ncbi:MAG TPA: ATP-binding protein [Dongiaceae bacterium]|nr:ATP-binding protein [Dongiaceae bacterium]
MFRSVRTRRQLTRFVLICTTVLAVQMAILGLGLAAIEAVDIARAYVNGETHYAQGQKSAVISLHRYVRSGEALDFADFVDSMRKPLGDYAARQALEQDPPNMRAAYSGLLQGGNDPADIKGIALVFRWFGETEYFAPSLQDWRAADRLMLNLDRLGYLIRDLMQQQALSDGMPAIARDDLRREIQNALRTVDQMDRSLTEIEVSFAAHIGAIARLSSRVVAIVLTVASLLLWLIGSVIIWRMYRKIVLTDRELEISEGRFRDFAETASDWFWETDADLKISYLSARGNDVFGLKPEDAIGRARIDVAGGSPDDPHWREHLAVLAARQPFRDFRYRLALAEGGERHVSASGRPVFDDEGRFHGYRGTGIDITSEMTAMASLRHAKEQAEIANRTKTTFLANMSHELRTPLNAILGFSEVIRDQLFGAAGNERYVDYARSINDAGRHLLRLINDLLDISRIESGRMDLQESLVDLRDVVRSCELLTREAARSNHLDLTVDIAPLIGRLRADERKLKQALLNLVGNAVKFTPAGGHIAVTATLLESGDVSIAVSDTGIGMAAADIPKALTPFMQIDGGLDRRHEGSGLGLPLARALIELHQGRLDIASSPGRGTTVTLILPAERHIRSAAPPVASDDGRAGAASGQASA